ncbi:MAG: hypothetical protein KDA84_08385 [Planctomycetaceae bacterium]|nr:hypothetical protein [Planctomycetaceae bacterium]
MITSVRSLFLLMLSCFLVLLAGCGKDEYPLASVSGKVTCNGKPLKDVIVVFQPTGDSTNKDFPGKAASGMTDENGEYFLSTFKPTSGDGAIIGSHTVTLSFADPTMQLDCEVPEGLTAEVEDKSNTINFEL